MPYARFIQDWLEGWNSRDVDRIMTHYSEHATFQSPSLLALEPKGDAIVRGRAAIRELYVKALERFPSLRFELEDVIERPSAVILLYRKINVFAEAPGLTVEMFELADGLVTRNVVYWGSEEVASRFQIRPS